MKTLSAVSRKVHSNVLSLALQPWLCNAIFQYCGAVPRQDVRISGGYLSAGFAWPKSASEHGEREALEPICERNEGGDRLQRIRHALRPKSSTDPPEER